MKPCMHRSALAASNEMWAPQLQAMQRQKVNLRAVLMRGSTACRDYWWALPSPTPANLLNRYSESLLAPRRCRNPLGPNRCTGPCNQAESR